jgi:hypothetical protein
MVKDNRTILEMRLSRHYAAQRGQATNDLVDTLVASMMAEDISTTTTKAQHFGFAAFVASQVRYIPAWTWMAQAALVALMWCMACTSTSADATKAIIGVLSAMTVLIGVPTVHTSKQHGVAELEYSCPNNAASVMVARLIILGCSSSLAVALMIGVVATTLDVGAFSVALWSCPPFFCSCAGSLAILRRSAPSTATALCAVWTIGCSAALVAAASVLPDMYGGTSLAVWAGASAVALAWLVREIAMTLRAVAAGLDAFSPHQLRTYN